MQSRQAFRHGYVSTCRKCAGQQYEYLLALKITNLIHPCQEYQMLLLFLCAVARSMYPWVGSCSSWPLSSCEPGTPSPQERKPGSWVRAPRSEIWREVCGFEVLARHIITIKAGDCSSIVWCPEALRRLDRLSSDRESIVAAAYLVELRIIKKINSSGCA
jgi:hypothetical protein